MDKFYITNIDARQVSKSQVIIGTVHYEDNNEIRLSNVRTYDGKINSLIEKIDGKQKFSKELLRILRDHIKPILNGYEYTGYWHIYKQAFEDKNYIFEELEIKSDIINSMYNT